jgi:hypothetical protein
MRSLVLGALLLTGCVTNDRPVTAVGNTYLVCGSTVRLDISHDGKSAVVSTSGGAQAVLKRVQSDYGTRYAGTDGSILRAGGTYIHTDREGHTSACDLLPR